MLEASRYLVVLITKALGSLIPIQILKFLIASIAGTLKKKSFNFRRRVEKEVVQYYMRKKHQDKVKLTIFYRDLEKVGLRMTDVEVIFKALGLARIPRLLNAGDKNWCSVPNRYFRSQESLNFLIQCNYDTKCFHQLPGFSKNILKFFQELKILYGYDQVSDLVLYYKKEI